jgi:hypothetical protein
MTQRTRPLEGAAEQIEPASHRRGGVVQEPLHLNRAYGRVEVLRKLVEREAQRSIRVGVARALELAGAQPFEQVLEQQDARQLLDDVLEQPVAVSLVPGDRVPEAHAMTEVLRACLHEVAAENVAEAVDFEAQQAVAHAHEPVGG